MKSFLSCELSHAEELKGIHALELVAVAVLIVAAALVVLLLFLLLSLIVLGLLFGLGLVNNYAEFLGLALSVNGNCDGIALFALSDSGILGGCCMPYTAPDLGWGAEEEEFMAMLERRRK